MSRLERISRIAKSIVVMFFYLLRRSFGFQFDLSARDFSIVEDFLFFLSVCTD